MKSTIGTRFLTVSSLLLPLVCPVYGEGSIPATATVAAVSIIDIRHDGDRVGRARRSLDARSGGNDHIDTKCDQFLHECRKALGVSFGGATL